MTILDNRGQMGPIGEDYLYYTLVFIIIAFVLMLAIVTFADYESKYGKIDGFRISQANADKAAVVLAVNYKTDVEAKLFRVLDSKKITDKLTGGAGCEGICEKCSICVKDRRSGKEYFCGENMCGVVSAESDYVTPTIRLPVAIKMNDKEFHPGILIASMVIKEPDSSSAGFEEIDDTPYLEPAPKLEKVERGSTGSDGASNPDDSKDTTEESGRPDQSLLNSLCKDYKYCTHWKEVEKEMEEIDGVGKPLGPGEKQQVCDKTEACAFVEDDGNPYRTPPVMYDCSVICGSSDPCDTVFVAYMDKNSDYWTGCCCQ